MQVHLDKLKKERIRLKEAREVTQEQLNQARQGHHDVTCNLTSARIAGNKIVAFASSNRFTSGWVLTWFNTDT